MKNKIFTKLLSITLVCVMLIMSMGAYGGENPSSGVNYINNMHEDNIINAYVFSRPTESTTSTRSSLNAQISINNYIGLYSPNNEIIAFYIEEDNGQYAVVNSVVDNPIYLEYGIVDETLRNIDLLEKVYYLMPGVFATCTNDGDTFLSLNGSQEYTYAEAIGIATVFNEIREEYNAEMIDNISQMNTNVQRGGSSSIIVSYSGLPTGNYTGASVSNFSNIQFSNSEAIWGDYVGGAYVDNNCASTAAFNVLLYYRHKFNNPIAFSSRLATQKKVHEYIKNGPISPTFLNSRFNSYINNETNYNLNMATTTTNFDNLKTRISNDQLLYFVTLPLLDLGSAHTFIGYGYIEDTSSGKHYVRVMDGWTSSTEKYYLFATSLYQMGYIYLTQ